MFLLFLIDGARRFHKRTVDEIYKANEGITKEYAACAERSECLTLIRGRGDTLASLLEANGAQPLATFEIRSFESDIRTTLNRFGPNWADSHFMDFGAIPNSLSGQKDRINLHRNRLHNFIQGQIGQRQAIADKANSQKQEVLNKLSSTTKADALASK